MPTNASTQAAPHRAGLTTRAKNATQHPGLVDLEPQQKRRGPAEMAKVRSAVRLSTRLADQRLHAALNKVAEVQDRQQKEDIEANVPKVAPSLRHQKQKASRVPDDNNSLRDEDAPEPVVNAVETQVDPMDEYLSMDEEDETPVQAAPVRIAKPAPDYNDWFNFGSDQEDGPIAEEPPKKKKKGDGLRNVVATLRKNPPGENAALKVNLVTKVPPIPALNGKKPRSLCVNFSKSIIPKYFTDRPFFFFIAS